MMRDIKFRAWDGEEIITDWFKVIERPAQTVGDITLPPYKSPILNNSCPIEIMQYTGLMDKNGKEIYEGDILDLVGKCNSEHFAIVTWNDETCAFAVTGINDDDLSDHLYGGNLSEVIGNIYENPELLEVNENN